MSDYDSRDDHCFHHTCDPDDNDACAAGDCADEDDCVHCECCCSCLSCEYGPRDGMLMFPDGNPEIEAMAPSAAPDAYSDHNPVIAQNLTTGLSGWTCRCGDSWTETPDDQDQAYDPILEVEASAARTGRLRGAQTVALSTATRTPGSVPPGGTRAAQARYQRERYAAVPALQKRRRVASAARSRAVWRLAAEFPDRFRQLYLEEIRDGGTS